MLSMLKTGEVIKFDGSKIFKYLETLGRGGDGETMLFEDETTNMKFAIKKYSPQNLDYLDEDYKRFVEEIKILFKLVHPNIVRIYNYYLYPANKTGYLQMEYIKGVTINEFELAWVYGWEEIFVSTIEAFAYLEENNILHRDIRPANIMIDEKRTVKIIDFGFGKVIGNAVDEKASVVLNWPVSEFPQELQTTGTYNHQTEIFFVGKLFSKLPLTGIDDGFKYTISCLECANYLPKIDINHFLKLQVI